MADAGSGDQMFSIFPNSTVNDMLVIMKSTTVGILMLTWYFLYAEGRVLVHYGIKHPMPCYSMYIGCKKVSRRARQPASQVGRKESRERVRGHQETFVK